MLQVGGDPRRIDRAIKRLRGALKGVAAPGVRLTWRGGELRTTIHWARDDSFWWAFEPRQVRRTPRNALLLGHAPDAPAKRESITCEINLPRDSADRKVAGIIAADETGALYLAHSGRMGGARPGERPQPLFALVADGRPEELAMAVGSLSLAKARGDAAKARGDAAQARGGPDVRPILIAPATLAERDGAALDLLPFTCVRFHWRGARAVFDGLDDALE